MYVICNRLSKRRSLGCNSLLLKRKYNDVGGLLHGFISRGKPNERRGYFRAKALKKIKSDFFFA